LCVATLANGRISSSFMVVRKRSSYYSYAIRKTSQNFQIKQIKRGGGGGQKKQKTRRRWKKKL
jgi:hypothetical protein